jgi:peptidoglycan hydrolase-like protein with peptidoglycan-binding domain
MTALATLFPLGPLVQPPAFDADRRLGFGARGAEVEELQSMLNRYGVSVPVTGYYGTATRDAVRRAQRQLGLPVDGLAGPQTHRALSGAVHRADSFESGGGAPRTGAPIAAPGGAASGVRAAVSPEQTRLALQAQLPPRAPAVESPGTPDRFGVVPMNQGDYPQLLGDGNRTIRRAGCFLTSMAMASSRITGDTTLTPGVANERVKAAGGFSGSNLIDTVAADALGMRLTDRRGITRANNTELTQRLDASLEAGRPVVAGVNHTDGRSSSRASAADHFITIVARNADGSYTAIDPNGGREITLTVGADQRLHGRSPSGTRSYEVTELVFFERR